MAKKTTKTGAVTETESSLRDKIREIALRILENEEHGIRYTQLVSKILQVDDSLKKNTIGSYVWNLNVSFPDLVYKSIAGLQHHTKFKKDDEDSTIQSSSTIIESQTDILTIKEEEFYEPFADWLVHELEECTRAIGLGGKKFKDKWGTPDVIGKRQCKHSDILQFPTEIISGEIKTDTTELIAAFGQACAYKIFSHKSYIVVPVLSPIDDLARLDILCRQFGIGLILFNNQSTDDPGFEIRVRAVKSEPDMFFVNKYMKFVEDDLFSNS
jgi:hypothetical protein